MIPTLLIDHSTSKINVLLKFGFTKIGVSTKLFFITTKVA
jgi:hypothetical protein